MCGAAVEQLMQSNQMGNSTDPLIEGLEPAIIVSTLTFMNGVMFVSFLNTSIFKYIGRL